MKFFFVPKNFWDKNFVKPFQAEHFRLEYCYQLGLTPALGKGIFALKRAKIKCFILSFRMGPEVICHVSILEQLRPSLGLKILKLKVGQFWVGLQT